MKTNIADISKQQIRLAQSMLNKKYKQKFEVTGIGQRYGTQTNETFTVQCHSQEQPNVQFKAEVANDGAYMFDDYVAASVCNRLEQQFENACGDLYDDVILRISSRPMVTELDDPNIALDGFLRNTNADFVLYLATSESIEDIRPELELFLKDKAMISGELRYYDHVTAEQLKELKNKKNLVSEDFANEMDEVIGQQYTVVAFSSGCFE